MPALNSTRSSTAAHTFLEPHSASIASSSRDRENWLPSSCRISTHFPAATIDAGDALSVECCEARRKDNAGAVPSFACELRDRAWAALSHRPAALAPVMGDSTPPAAAWAAGGPRPGMLAPRTGVTNPDAPAVPRGAGVDMRARMDRRRAATALGAWRDAGVVAEAPAARPTAASSSSELEDTDIPSARAAR